MATITREQVIAYLDSLGDPVDWTGWTLEEIRDTVQAGDEYDGSNFWQDILDSTNAEDIA